MEDAPMSPHVTLSPKGRLRHIATRGSEVKTIIFPSANRRDFDELATNFAFDDEQSQR